MSVPLDSLYHWVEGLVPGPAILYVFRPYGSKKISDFTSLGFFDYDIMYDYVPVIMHDQEPLDWEFYNSPQDYTQMFLTQYQARKFYSTSSTNISKFTNALIEYVSDLNLRALILWIHGIFYDQPILVHSEKNSKDLDQYQQNKFLCVHYWAHAVIARDWYRFAEYDQRLCQKLQPKNKFLIYCRDWGQNREYRLKFLELLIENNLNQISQTSVMHVNGDDVHFLQHQFRNSDFELTNPELIASLPQNTFSSTTSAGYDPEDFNNSEISVVLETVFDGSKIHLTEKTLRPIACGHPFLLAAGPGALDYLRSYGFKTFDPWIDESYDLETNSLVRMQKIIQAMVKIQNLQGQELEEFLQSTKTIADYNKQHFFSSEFFSTVENELKNNLKQVYKLSTRTRGKYYLDFLRVCKKKKIQYPRHSALLLEMHFNRTKTTMFIRQLRQSYQSDLSNPVGDLPV